MYAHCIKNDRRYKGLKLHPPFQSVRRPSVFRQVPVESEKGPWGNSDQNGDAIRVGVFRKCAD